MPCSSMRYSKVRSKSRKVSLVARMPDRFGSPSCPPSSPPSLIFHSAFPKASHWSSDSPSRRSISWPPTARGTGGLKRSPSYSWRSLPSERAGSLNFFIWARSSFFRRLVTSAYPSRPKKFLSSSGSVCKSNNQGLSALESTSL